MAIDWLKIKTEYITTDTSYRKLSQKYGVAVKNICLKSKSEDWIGQRQQYVNTTLTKTVNREQNKAVDRYTRLTTVADKLLDKIETAVDSLDEESVLKLLNSTTIRSLSGALKDIKEIQSLKGDRDLREQDARIRKLEKEAEGEEKETTVVVQFVGDDDYSR